MLKEGSEGNKAQEGEAKDDPVQKELETKKKENLDLTVGRDAAYVIWRRLVLTRSFNRTD